VERQATDRIDERILLAPRNGRTGGRDIWVVPVHVVRACFVERLRDGDGPLGCFDRDRKSGIERAEAVGSLPCVVDFPHVEEGIQLLHRGRHHELVGRHRLRERGPLRRERQHRASETLLRVLDEERDGAGIDVDLLGVCLVGEVDVSDLRLLKRELEETQHLFVVRGGLHPTVDERPELRWIGFDRFHFVIGGGKTYKNVLDLCDVCGRRIGLERLYARVRRAALRSRRRMGRRRRRRKRRRVPGPTSQDTGKDRRRQNDQRTCAKG